MTAPFRFIRRLDTTVSPDEWAYRRTHAAAIRSAWARWTREQPSLFNGRVLLLIRSAVEADVFRGVYAETDFAAFLHFMRLGASDGTSRNGFALAALTSADGALIMGVMAAHTANAGKIYFPGGTPDPSDIVGPRVDLAGSVTRELAEETGLEAHEVAFDEGFWLFEDDKRAAFLKIVRSPLEAGALRETILARMSRQAAPELADIHVVRGPGDLRPERMPAFQLAYARWWLERGGVSPPDSRSAP